MKAKTPKALIPALRQYRHNNNDGFLAGYDREDANIVFYELQMQIIDLKAALRSCANASNGALDQYK